MSARLEIHKIISPPNLWIWVVMLDDKQVFCSSKKSFSTFDYCMKDASTNALEYLLKAEEL